MPGPAILWGLLCSGPCRSNGVYGIVQRFYSLLQVCRKWACVLYHIHVYLYFPPFTSEVVYVIIMITETTYKHLYTSTVLAIYTCYC